MTTETLRSMIEDHELFVRENLPQDIGKIASVKEIRRSLQFQSTITAEEMRFSYKRAVPFERPSIAGSMVSAALLRKINPNYFRPYIIEPVKQKSTDIGYLFWGQGRLQNHVGRGHQLWKQPTELKENELVICCPTVPGFGFGDKLWCNNFPIPVGHKR